MFESINVLLQAFKKELAMFNVFNMLLRVLLATAIVAVFWGIWSVFAPVPKTSEIVVMSRWWDVLFAPIWAFILVSIFAPKKTKKVWNVSFALIFGLFFGVIEGCLCDFVLGGNGNGEEDLIMSLIVGLECGLALNLGIYIARLGLDFAMNDGMAVGLGFAIGTGLVIGLIFGLGIGLIFSLDIWIGVFFIFFVFYKLQAKRRWS